MPDFVLDETIEQQRPTKTEVELMRAELHERAAPSAVAQEDENEGLPLSVLMVIVIVGTCAVYAAISLLFFSRIIPL